MIPCEQTALLQLYAQIAPGTLFRQLQRNEGLNVRDGIYTPRVLIGMMLVERLDPKGTVAQSVEQVASGQLDCLLSQCKRARTRQISLATGGYCQARQHLPMMLLRRAMDEIVLRLRQTLQARLGGSAQSVYALDGSSIQLQDEKLRAQYPSARNQHRASHWPQIRIVVAQDVETGLAERPQWGPQNGPNAVSEQTLAERVLEEMPSEAVIIGDRNFGIFSIAYRCHLRGQRVVIRLTEQRAKALVGKIAAEGVYPAQWCPSRFERNKWNDLPEDAMVSGRVIARRIGRGKSKEWLFLFTTWTMADEEILATYAKRWRVETDLRSLKQTMRLRRINVRSADMLHKELMAAIMAYNLVRAVMCLAAWKAGVTPRQLSFTRAYTLVHASYSRILNISDHQDQLRTFEQLVDWVSQCKLYPRSKPRSYPRRVWNNGTSYPLHHPTEN